MQTPAHKAQMSALIQPRSECKKSVEQAASAPHIEDHPERIMKPQESFPGGHQAVTAAATPQTHQTVPHTDIGASVRAITNALVAFGERSDAA